MDSNRFALGLAIVPAIDEILRDGARRALQAAIECEVEEYIERNKQHRDDRGHQLVVRNGIIRLGRFFRAMVRSKCISQG